MQVFLRFRRRGCSEDATVKNVFLALDMLSFFDMLDKDRYHEAVRTMGQIRIVPVEPVTIQESVRLRNGEVLIYRLPNYSSCTFIKDAFPKFVDVFPTRFYTLSELCSNGMNWREPIFLEIAAPLVRPLANYLRRMLSASGKIRTR